LMKMHVAFSTLLIGILAMVTTAQPPKPEKQVPLSLPDGVTPDQLADPKEAARVADLLDKQYPKPQPESVKMLVTLLRKGIEISGNDGWFGPAESRYTWEWLKKRHALASDAKAIPKEKFNGPARLFERLDRDGDGTITPGDLDWSERNPYVQQLGLVSRLFRRMNTAGTGKLTRDDLDDFFKKAARGKDHITPEDLRTLLIPPGGGYLPGDIPSIPTLVRGFFGGEIGSLSDGPKFGSEAPDFTLKTVDGKEAITLSKLVGPKPVVLVFGNFTCGPFRAFYPEVEAVHQRFKDDATFIMVYVREAHPSNGWAMESNTRAGVAVKQPTTFVERVEVCNQFCQKLKPSMPVVVDEINDPVNNAYSGVPSRLYVIDKKGKVAFKNGRGPFGFRVGELEQALVMNLLESTSSKDSKSDASRVPIMSDKEAWRKLPKAQIGGGQPLPNWAKVVADHLPRTTAAMLELDYAQRIKSPIDPALRAKMRWVIAQANRSEYAQATAIADLMRAAGTEAVKILIGDPKSWPADDVEPLEFVRLLTHLAHFRVKNRHF
jgi:thiol-disulfide isomerase/thioredoxin